MEYGIIAALVIAFAVWGLWNRKDERKDAERDIGEREFARGFQAGAEHMLIEQERLRRLDATAAAQRQLFLPPPRADHITVDDDHEIVVRKKPHNKRKAART